MSSNCACIDIMDLGKHFALLNIHKHSLVLLVNRSDDRPGKDNQGIVSTYLELHITTYFAAAQRLRYSENTVKKSCT